MNINGRIGFYLYAENHWAHLEPIIKHLPEGLVEIVTPETRDVPKFVDTRKYKFSKSIDILASGKKYRCMVSLYMMPPDWWKNNVEKKTNELNDPSGGYFKSLAKHNVRMVYSLGALPWNTSGVMKGYDSIFVYGPHEENIYREKFGNTINIHQVGYPKFDFHFTGISNQTYLEKKLLPDRKTILWLPTKGKLSSIEKYADIMIELCTSYNVILKPHPQEDLEILKKIDSTAVILSKSYDSAPYYKLADFVFCDYGGSAFGALYVDKPIIFLSPDNPERDSRNYSSESPEVELRSHFLTFDKCTTIEITRKLNDQAFWNGQKGIRETLRKKYFKCNYGSAGKQAADFLKSCISN